MTKLADIFAAGGQLSTRISGYKPRPEQLEMAESIASAIRDKHHFVAEAGTGTGKTFAYLIPAILSGQRIIVSTGTKNLQDQLYNKDIPVLRSVLSVPFQAALLKGRANYLCRYRMESAMETDSGFSRSDAADINRIYQWAGKTRIGDIAEVSSVPETSLVWSQVTSTADNCLGQECPEYDECFLVKSRRKAQDAELLVVNHHLLCADWALRDDGFGELLPNADVIIVDEAHQLYETASRFLGLSVSARQIIELGRDVVAEQVKDAGDMPALRSAADGLEKTVLDLRLDFGQPIRRGSWQELAHNQKVLSGLQKLQSQLKKLDKLLESAAERSKGLDACWHRCSEMSARLSLLIQEDDGQWIRWFETHKRTFTLSRTPFEIADEFQHLIHERKATWIYTSATLTVANRFEHFTSTLGLNDTEVRSWGSPFDYSSKSVFYHPRNLPDPASPDYIRNVAETAIPVINASRGRTFFLFTSHRALRQTAEILRDKLDYPLLVQGAQPKSVLIDKFKSHGNSVLLGTASFWEGVDVRGGALSCVIIDKLPFASPGDPVMKARLESLRKRGENPFKSFQIPMAVIALKQGVGRLIRDENDRGVFMLCDPRLLKRSYGRTFLESLPAMRRTRDIEEVQSFFDVEYGVKVE